MSAPGLLHGLRIVACTDYGAGPFSMQMLADLGADVIKIETIGSGDSSRYVPPFQEGSHSLFFESVNRRTRSVQLDLKDERGRVVLRRLVAASDAVFSNLRGSATKRLGLRYEDLREVNQKVVCCFLNGWGSHGPRSDDPAYDYGIQAYTGHMALTGEPGQPPARSSAPWVDFGCAMTAALGLLAGVRDAGITGRGRDIDVSMVDFAMSMWTYMGTGYLSRGLEPERTSMSAHQSVVPSQVFVTADTHVAVMCQTDRFWRILCERMELPELLADDALATLEGRRRHRGRVLQAVQDRFLEHTTAFWVERLGGYVPIEPVHGFAEAFAAYESLRPHQVREVPHDVLGTYRLVGSPIDVGADRLPERRAPYLGEHTREVLQDVAHLAPEEIEELLRSGVARQGGTGHVE